MILRETLRRLSAGPSVWTQKRSARGRQGYPVAYNSPEATCWCVAGMMNHVGNPDFGAVLACYIKLADLIDPDWRFNSLRTASQVVTDWNDHRSRTHAEVLDLLRKATTP